MKKTKKQYSIETLKFERPDDNKLLFEIIDLSTPDRQIPATVHRHEFYEIIIILKGETKQLIDFKTYSVKNNNVLVVPKGSIHQGSFKEKLNGYIILFTPDFFSKEQCDFLARLQIFNASFNSNLIQFNQNDWDEVILLFNCLKEEYFIQHKTKEKNALRFLLLALVAKLNNFKDHTLQSKLNASDIVKQFFDLLETNFKTQHLVSFYCSQLNTTSKKLLRALTNATGKTTLEIINDRLVLEAKRELLFSYKAIKEIAYELGFDDPFYFSKFFKKHTKYSPEIFKKEYSEISM